MMNQQQSAFSKSRDSTEVEHSINHHYIPQWYQSNFLPPGESKLWIRDLAPKQYKTANGMVIGNSISQKGPKSSFKERFLYTVNDSDEPDIIERRLFGRIDDQAAKAVDGLIRNDLDEIIKNCIGFLEFLSVFRYRTPKGIDLIKQFVNSNNQNDLMDFLARQKADISAMIGECFIEIASSHNERNFIFSDYPFVLYNPACYPGSIYCKYPNDPQFECEGTQGFIPLSPNHCLIVTHRDWARKRGKGNGLSLRINARRNGTTLVDLRRIIRSRNLSQTEVDRINYITFKRAHKYIACQKRNEIYPENQIQNRSWDKFYSTLLPPLHEVSAYGNNVSYLLGGNSGAIWAQNEYGQPRPPFKADNHHEK